MRERVTHKPEQTWLSRIGGFVDRCVYAVAPTYGFQRIQMRATADARLSTFEGAAHDETRSASWIGSRLSPDAAMEVDLQTLRTRGHELYRNDSYGGSIDNVVNHVVGTGFTPQCRISERLVGLEASQVFCEELEGIYKRWSPKADITGRISLWQQSRLAERHILASGEGLAVISDDPAKDAPIPLTIEIIDPERLETPIGKIGDPLVRMGIEKDSAGRILAYWIRRTHPGDTTVNLEYDRIPADRVLHIYERWFAGQSRGLPWLCRALNRIKDCKDLDEAEIIAAQVQACFAVFVNTPINPATAAASAASSTDGTLRYEDVKPGAIHYRNGGDVTFANPTRPGNSFAPFQEWNYRRIAAALNVPYEILVKNWGGLSFAAGRLVLAEWRLDVKSRQKLLVEQVLCPIWHRMVNESVMLGACSIEPRNWSARPWVYQDHCWTPPAWPYAITPGEEIKANIEAVNNNQRTLASVIAETGEDMEDVLDQRAREMQLQRDRDILPPEVKTVDVAAEAATAKAAGGSNGE
jgi:lambda family phage portal protein